MKFSFLLFISWGFVSDDNVIISLHRAVKQFKRSVTLTNSAACNPAGTLKLMSTLTFVFWSVSLIIGTWKKTADLNNILYLVIFYKVDYQQALTFISMVKGVFLIAAYFHSFEIHFKGYCRTSV